MASLVSLIGFGLDSGLESAASVLVGLRLAARLRDGEADTIRERRTPKAVAIMFFVQEPSLRHLEHRLLAAKAHIRLLEAGREGLPEV